MHVLYGAIQLALDDETAEQPSVVIEDATMKMAVSLTQYFQDQRHVYEEVGTTRCACTARVAVVVLCLSVSVCLSVHTLILAVHAITGNTEDTIVLSVEIEAIVKRHFS